MEINSRISAVRKAVGLSQREFGSRIGISDAAVSRLESGSNNPADRTIRVICQTFRVSEAWLRDGIGEMFLQETPAEAVLRVMEGEDELAKQVFLTLAELPPECWQAFHVFAQRLRKRLDELPPNEKGDP